MPWEGLAETQTSLAGPSDVAFLQRVTNRHVPRLPPAAQSGVQPIRFAP